MRLGAYVGPAASPARRWPPLRRRGRLRAPPPPLRGQSALSRPPRGGRAGLLGHLAGRPPRRVHRAAGPPVLGRHPGASGVQEPAGPAAPALPRAGRRGAAPGARAHAAALRPRQCPLLSRMLRSGDCPPPTAERPGGRPGRRSARSGSGRGSPATSERRRRARSSARTASPSSARSSGHPGAVCVVPLESDRDHVLMIRQYRGAVDRPLLELPAGKRDVPGEAPDVCAARELEEEIGAEAGG